MEVIGIICEYNPLHNGHIYHIQKIKEKYPNSLIILVLKSFSNLVKNKLNFIIIIFIFLLYFFINFDY